MSSTSRRGSQIAPAEELLAEARRRTGIDLVDRDAVEPLGVLLRSLNGESGLHPAGARGMQDRLLRILSNRLRMKRDFLANPEIHDERITAPIFICGMARTGSTKTQKLLAAAGDFNWLAYWQVLNPALLTGDRAESAQPRINDTDTFVAWFDAASPETRAGHAFETREPEEESFILEHSLRTPTFLGWAPIDGYLEWLFKQDMSAQFVQLRDTLKYLQWQGLADGSKRWVLKSPLYSGLELKLLETFPDAHLLMTHRHPAQTIASGLRLLECFYRPYSTLAPNVESYVTGQATAINGHLDCRQALPPDTFFDIDFSALVRNTHATVEATYRFCSMELSAEAAARVAAGDKANPPGKYGTHQYSLQQYGLTAHGISELFDRYVTFLRGRFPQG